MKPGVDICVPYSPREDLILPAQKALSVWADETAQSPPDTCDLYIGEAWTDGYFHFSRARNLATAQGCREYILCVDADMVIQPQGLAQLRAVISNHDQAAPPVLNLYNWRVPDDYWPNRKLDTPPIRPEVIEWLNEFPHNPDTWQRIFDSSIMWRGNTLYGPILVPRVAWEEVGGYHEGYVSWGCEDDDFVERLRRAHHPVIKSGLPAFIQCPHPSTRFLEKGSGSNYHTNLELLKQRLSK